MSTGPVFTAGGLASGIDTTSLIDQLISIERRPITLLEQRIQTFNLQRAQIENIGGRASTLQNTVSSLLAKSVLDENVFRSKSATSSNDDISTVNVTEEAAPQTLQLEVLQLATATKAQGQSALGQIATDTDIISTLGQGAFTDGDFTIYVDGVPNTITVDITQPMSDVLNQITAIGGGITGASLVNGQIQIDYTNGTDVHIGSQSDTSNFARVTQLDTAAVGATSVLGSRPLTTLNTAEAMNSATSGMTTTVTDGTFSINGVEFDTTGKTLSEMLTEINNSSEAGVTATINRLTNRLELSSDETGSNFINLAEGTSNFLTATGLVVGGNTITSQTAGQNASFNLNGTLLYSADNSVGEDITGAVGVTLQLEKTNVGEPIDITIDNDTSKLKESLTTMVANINSLFTLIESETDSEANGSLAGDNSMTRFRSDVRSILTSGVNGLSTFTNLAAIGISTGAVGSSTGSATSTYSLNESTLDEALASNPAEVEAMLIGTGGILEQLDALLEQATNDDTDETLDGLFATKTNSIGDQIDNLNNRIDEAELRLEQRETLLRRQFQAMEQAYSRANQQSSSLNGLLSQLGANSGG